MWSLSKQIDSLSKVLQILQQPKERVYILGFADGRRCVEFCVLGRQDGGEEDSIGKPVEVPLAQPVGHCWKSSEGMIVAHVAWSTAKLGGVSG